MKEIDIWDRYFYALALYKNNFGDNALEICRDIYRKRPLFNPNNSLYALNVQRKTLFKIDYSDKNNILKAINAIKKLIPENDKFLSYEQVIYTTLKKIETEKHFSFLLWLLDNLQPSKQDFEKLENYEDKKIKYPSFVETYYVVKIRTNFTLKNYNESIELVDKALKTVRKFYYNNHIWIRRIKALALAEIGKEIFALKEFFFILRFKKDWFILFEISQILLKINMQEAAVYFAMRALLDNLESKYKIKLYVFFIENSDTTFPKKIAQQLLKKVYSENKMLMNTQIQQICNDTEISSLNVRKLDRQLKDFAKSQLFSNEYNGTITRIFNKFSGLIKTEKKIMFYSIEDKKIELTENMQVKYIETWNFDTKKMQVRKSALIVRKI